MISLKDRNTLRESLITAFTDFTQAFQSFDPARINHKPVNGEWSPAQVVQHILLGTDGVPDGRTAVLTSQRGSDRYDLLLARIRPWWEDVNQKFQSPEILRPDENPRDKDTLVSSLERNLAKDLSILDHQDLTEVCLDFELPNVGYLTRYEWLWFIEMHLKRHTYQLNNMKSQLLRITKNTR